ncbi:hypothetical protein ACHAXR_011964 [Thalassiosira sp. AJA248-18]
MPPKPTPSSSAMGTTHPKPQVISAAVKAAAAASKAVGGTSGGITTKQPPKKKKQVVKSKRPGGRNSPVVVIGKDDTLHPSSKLGVMKHKPIIGKPSSNTAAASTTTTAVNSIKFSSQYASSLKKKTSNIGGATASHVGSSGGGNSNNSKLPNISSTANSASQLNQFKLEKAQIAKRELAEMDAIERAFREDENVWTGPKNLVFPKRYHRHADKARNDEAEKKKDGDGEDGKMSSISNNPYMTLYGSQSQGWMYGEGYAGIGGRSWTEVTAANTNTTSTNAVSDKKKNKKNDSSPTPPHLVDDTTTTNNNKSNNPSFLMDDVTIIENSLKANGLTRTDLTPKAYACFLEQARRYALELLADAQDYAIHAQRNTIPALLPADILLAVEMREDGGGGGGGVQSTLPSPQQISDLASEVNRAPLPPIPINCYNGVALPPVEQQLTARTYDVVNGARVAQRMMRGGDLPLTSIDLGSGLSSSSMTEAANKKAKGGTGTGTSNEGTNSKKKKVGGSYGAGKGRQIAVHIKSKTSGSTSASAAGGAAASNKATGSSTLASVKSTTTTTGTAKSGPKQKRKLTEL